MDIVVQFGSDSKTGTFINNSKTLCLHFTGLKTDDDEIGFMKMNLIYVETNQDNYCKIRKLAQMVPYDYETKRSIIDTEKRKKRGEMIILIKKEA